MENPPNPSTEKFQKLKNIVAKCKAWCSAHNTQLIYVRDFLFNVIVYGILLNYVLTILFKYPFDLKILLALGIGFYFIKEELPRIISKSIPRNRS